MMPKATGWNYNPSVPSDMSSSSPSYPVFPSSQSSSSPVAIEASPTILNGWVASSPGGRPGQGRRPGA